MRSAYDTSLHPDVVAGRLTKDDALRNFMSQVSSVVVLASCERCRRRRRRLCALCVVVIIAGSWGATLYGGL